MCFIIFNSQPSNWEKGKVVLNRTVQDKKHEKHQLGHFVHAFRKRKKWAVFYEDHYNSDREKD